VWQAPDTRPSALRGAVQTVAGLAGAVSNAAGSWVAGVWASAMAVGESAAGGSTPAPLTAARAQGRTPRTKPKQSTARAALPPRPPKTTPSKKATTSRIAAAPAWDRSVGADRIRKHAAERQAILDAKREVLNGGHYSSSSTANLFTSGASASKPPTAARPPAVPAVPIPADGSRPSQRSQFSTPQGKSTPLPTPTGPVIAPASHSVSSVARSDSSDRSLAVRDPARLDEPADTQAEQHDEQLQA
jgi:hypothetical protein